MFVKGDIIVYGLTGVCRVDDVKPLSGVKAAEKGKLYYVLTPLYQNGTIYAPVDSEKVYIRKIMTREQAQELIALIPGIDGEAYNNANLQLLNEHYRELISSHDGEALIELTKSIYAKKKAAQEQKRKIGQVDEEYMKRAEELLFGELAAALGIEKDDVPAYIEKSLKI